MLDTAQEYENAVSVITGKTIPTGASAQLLGILAFEILLKAAWLLEKNKIASFGHNYVDGFAKLSDPTKVYVIEKGNQEFETYSTLNLVSVDSILKDLEKNFLDGRYDYEVNMELSDFENEQKGINWHRAGSDLAKADFRYRPDELDALRYGLRCWVEDRLRQTD